MNNIMKSSILIIPTILAVTIVRVKGQVHFTSVEKLEQLLMKESFVLEDLWNCIEEAKVILNTLRTFLEELKSNHEVAISNRSKFIGNPVNAFRLIKRLAVDVREYFKKTEEAQQNLHMPVLSEGPTIQDLIGTVDGISRISYTYDFSLEKILVNGMYGPYETDSPLLGDDILVYYLFALFGNLDPLDHYPNKVIVDSYDLNTLFAVMIKSIAVPSSNYVLYSNQTFAIYFSRLLIPFIHVRDYAKVDELLAIFTIEYPEEAELVRLNVEHFRRLIEVDNIQFITGPVPISYKNELYNKLCQGTLPVSEKVKSQLVCYLESYNKTYLRINPFKIEVLQWDPRIVKIHQAITPNETTFLINHSKNKIYRGKTINNGKAIFTDSRLSNCYFVPPHEVLSSKLLSDLTKKIEEMTNLVPNIMREAIQVNNYGLGGYYDIHSDCTSREEVAIGGVWRIATLMFYLTDVEVGGATVFPALNLTVFPEKGSAVFWYNAHANTLLDHRMYHSGCPVALGNKWVANQWFGEEEQMFKRPCVLGEYMTTEEDIFTGHWKKIAEDRQIRFTLENSFIHHYGEYI